MPLLLGLDVIHGHRTIFPVPLAEACLFAPDLWEKTARAAAEEATQDGVALTFAPMLDVARDPRWGRIVEGPGEDAWVASQMAAAKTRGFQGPRLALRQQANRRLAADVIIVLADCGGPIAGDIARERAPGEPGAEEIDDVRIAKKIVEKGLDGIG